METFDRRRIAAAALVTVSVLALLWVFSSGSDNDGQSSEVPCADCEDDSGNSAPPTTAYEPFPPLFVGGGEDPAPPDPVSIATAPEPAANEVRTTTQFVRIRDTTDAEGNPITSVPRCSTMIAPEGALLTVLNVDNGQSTTCTNTQGIQVPPGVDMVMGTDVFALIGDLSDAPLPVRISWEDEPADDN